MQGGTAFIHLIDVRSTLAATVRGWK